MIWAISSAKLSELRRMGVLHLMNRVWITRTMPSAEESAQLWRAADFDPLVEPLLDIQSVDHDKIEIDSVLIFTSKNAIDYIDCHGQRAICVGDATADKARLAGFNDVVSVDGTSADVTDWVRENLPKTQNICHVSGWHVRGSISEDLQAAGYAAKRVKVYRSRPRPVWPDRPISLVALYSPLAAQTFVEAAHKRDVSMLSAICISQAVADELPALQLKSIYVAAHPREDELIMAAKAV